MAQKANKFLTKKQKKTKTTLNRYSDFQCVSDCALFQGITAKGELKN